MRQKRVKGVDENLLSLHGVITDIKTITLPNMPIEIEIGSGKGEFITSLAKDHPDVHYIALEKNLSVCYRILEKKELLKINNLTIILGDAAQLLTYLGHTKVRKIYLNFSDPWPKKRHHKRRLTAETFIPLYLQILTPEGILQLRTDHQGLFDDSIDSLSKSFDIIEINRDLKPSNYMTEYEIKKRLLGPIYQLSGRKKHVTNSL